MDNPARDITPVPQADGANEQPSGTDAPAENPSAPPAASAEPRTPEERPREERPREERPKTTGPEKSGRGRPEKSRATARARPSAPVPPASASATIMNAGTAPSIPAATGTPKR